MTKIKRTGPSASVHWDGGSVMAEQGTVVEVPAATAKQLAQSPGWELSKATKKTKEASDGS